jgi:hypothetical protein
MELDPRVALVGLVVGLVVGFSGVGGGSLVTPLLVLAMGIPPAIAVGTDLLYSAPTKLLGALIHHRQRTVDWRLVRQLAAGGVPGAFAGLVALAGVQHRAGLAAVNAAIRHGLGAMLVLVALALVLRPLLGRWWRPTDAGDAALGRRATARIVVLGAVVGFLVSLTSIGSGALTVPLLYFLLPGLGLRRLVGADVAFAAVLIPLAAAGHLALGQADVPLAANLVVGSLPGVFLGSRLCAYVPEAWLRPGLAGILLFAGSKLL